ncbi:hypothetical protein M959_07530, partial [Chaetura pelagica]
HSQLTFVTDFVWLPVWLKGREECALARECCCPVKNVFGWRSSFSWMDCGFWQQRWQEVVAITTIPLKKKPTQALSCYHPFLHISRNWTSSEIKPGDDLNKHDECGQRKWLL